MATEIDKRVVEMQFDNRDFERNCQASLTTLEKLKMALNFDGAKGLDTMAQAANKIDLSNVAKGAEAVEVKFSAMNIAGMTAISELTKGFLNLGKTIWSSTFGLAKSGGMARTLKIEQATFQMKALAKNIKGVGDNTEKVNALIKEMGESIDQAVTGTAYGYDAAASVASQLMASGVTDSKTMLGHLKGIAGAAAMTGRSFEDIGNIFTTVASNGRLMTMQLRQFSAAGLNLSATIGQNLGKTEDEVNEMVRKGQISFEQFSKALQDAFGDAASKADDTFSGVTSNIQAQIKRLGQIFTDPFVEHVVPFLKEVKDAIKRFNGVLKPLGKTFELVFSNSMEKASEALHAFQVSRLGSIVHGIENIFAALFSVIWTVKEALKELFPPKTLDQLQTAATDFELFTRQLLPSKETLEGLKNILILLLSPLRIIFNIVTEIWHTALKPTFVVLTRLLGALLRLGRALNPIVSRLTKSLTKFELLEAVLKIITATVSVVVDWFVQLVDLVGQLITEFANSKSFDKFVSTLQSLGMLLSKIIIAGLYLVYKVLSGLLSLLNLETIQSFINGVTKAFGVFIAFIQQGILTILNIIEGFAQMSDVFGDVWSFLQEIVNIVKAFFSGEDVSDRLEKLRGILNKLGDDIKKLADNLFEYLKQIDIGQVILVAFAIGVIFLVWSIKNLVDASTKLVLTVNSIGSVFAGLKATIATAAKYNGIFQVLLGVAIALSSFAAALSTISEIPKDRLEESARILGIFAGAIMAFSIAMMFLAQSTTNAVAITNVMMTLLGIAGAILMLSLAIRSLSETKMSLEEMEAPLIAIIALMGSLTIVAISLSNLSGKASLAIGGILAFAASIWILVKGLESLTKLDIEKVENVLAAFLAIIITYGAAMGLASLGGMSFGAGAGFIGAALSLLILLSVLKKLSEFPFDLMQKGLNNMVAILIPLMAFMVMAGALTKLSGNNKLIKDISGIIISFTISIASLALLAKKLGEADQDTIDNGIASILLIGALIGSIVRLVLQPLTGVTVINFRAQRRAINGLVGVIVGLTVLIGIAGLLAIAFQEYDVKKIALAIGLVMSVVLSIGALMYFLITASANTEKAKAAPILAMMVGLMSIVSVIIIAASFMSDAQVDKLWSIGAITTVIIVALDALLYLMEKMSSNPNANAHRTNFELVALLISVSIMIGALIGLMFAILYTMEQLDGMDDRLIQATQNILLLFGMILLSIALITKAIDQANSTNFPDKVDSVAKLVGSVALLALIVAGGIAAISYFSKDISGERLANIMAGMTMMLLAMIGMIAICIREISSGSINASDLNDLFKVFRTLTGTFAIMALSIAALSVITKDIDGTQMKEKSIAAMLPMILMFLGIYYTLEKTPTVHGVEFKKKVEAMANAIIISAGGFALMAEGLSMLALVANYIPRSKLAEILLYWTIAAGLIAGFTLGITYLSQKAQANSFDPKAFKSIAISILIASSAFAVIAASMSAIALVVKGNKFDANILVAFIVMCAAAAEIMAGIFSISAIIKSTNISWREIISIGSSMALASVVFLSIAAAISIIASIKIDNTFGTKMGLFLIVLTMFLVTFSVLAYIAQYTQALDILAIGASFVMASTAILIIAEAMKMLAEVDTSVDWGEVVKMLAIATIAFVMIGAIGGLLGAAGGVGTAVLIGIAALCGAFTLFAAGVYLLADAAKTFSEAIQVINNSDLDAQKIENNASNAIHGIVRAIMNCIPDILAVIGILIVAIMAILGSQQVKLALMAVAWFTAFVYGLAAAAPIITKALDVIMNKVNEYLESDETMDRFSRFAYNVGTLIRTILLDFVRGILGDVYVAIDEMFTWLNEAANNAPGGAGWEQKKSHEKQVSDFDKDIYDKVGAYYFNDPSYFKEYADVYSKFKGGKLSSDAYLKFLDGFNSEISSMSTEQFEAFVKNVNQVADSCQAMGVSVGEEFIKPVQYMANFMDEETKSKLHPSFGVIARDINDIGDEFEETTVTMQQLAGSMDDTSIKSGTLTRETEETSNAMKETATSASEASDAIKEVSESGSNDLKEMKETMKSLDFKSMADGLNDALGNTFGEDSFLKDLFGTDSLKKLTPTLEKFGSKAGFVMGDKAGEMAYRTAEEWVEYGEEIIDQSAWNTSGGKLGKRWQEAINDAGEKFKNIDEYVNYMQSKQNTLSLDYIMDLTGWKFGSDEITDDINSMTDSLGGLGSEAESTKSKMEEFTDSLKDSIKNSLNLFDELSEQEEISPEEMLDRMFGHISQVAEWAHNITVLAARGMSEGLLNELKELGPQGAAKVKAFVNMTDAQLREANLLYQDAAILPDAATNKIIKSYKDAGFNASMGFSNGIDQNAADEAMRNLGTNSLNALEDELEINSPSKKTMKDGEYSTEGLAKGLVDAKSQSIIKNSTHILAGLLMNGLRSELKPEAFNKIGQQAMQGLGLGITNNIPAIIAKISSVASNIITTLANALKIKSPSKVMEELGEYTMLGFGNGMEEGGTSVEKITEQQANDILDAMKANIAAITNGWSEDNVYQPVIRPVFDMSAIGQGYSDIQTWFSNANGVDISGNLSRLTPTNKESTDVDTQLLNAIRDFNNDDVVSEISALRDDISQLQDAMTNLQVVMNTGALVGQIVEPMDIALGSRALRNRRGR